MIITNQLNRLKQDKEELGHYIKRLQKRGKNDIAEKVGPRLYMIQNAIAKVENRTRG